jgi:hypothetical protein
MDESFSFSAAICWTVNVTGWLGNDMANSVLEAGEKASEFPGQFPGSCGLTSFSGKISYAG